MPEHISHPAPRAGRPVGGQVRGAKSPLDIFFYNLGVLEQNISMEKKKTETTIMRPVTLESIFSALSSKIFQIRT